MVTIRRISVILLCLVVITSLSFTAFASGEQPTGTTYDYITKTGNSYTGTYWDASNHNMNTIADIMQFLYNGSFNYYISGLSGTHNASFFTAVANSLRYIGEDSGNILSKVIQSTTHLTNISTYLSSIQTFTQTLKNDVTAIKPKITSIDTSTQSIDTTTQSIDSRVANIYSYMSTNNRMPSGSNYYYFKYDEPGHTSRANYWNAVTYGITHLNSLLEDLHTMYASPEDLALKADQENNISSATTNFLSGNDSATSVGTGSIGKVKDLGDGAASFFDTGVNATSLFTLLSDNSNDGPWTWFTQAVADDLDAVAAANRNSRSNSSSESVVDFYSDKMAALDKLLGSIAEVDSRKSQNYVYTSSDFQPDPDPWEVDVID